MTCERNPLFQRINLSRLHFPLGRVEFGYANATRHTCITIVRIVLDTSVLVAAARSRNGASYQLVSMLPSPRFDIALTIPLCLEELLPLATAGQKWGLTAFGGGFTFGGAVLEVV